MKTKTKPAAKAASNEPIALSAVEAANQALQPALTYAAPGGKHSAIAASMALLTGQKVTRQMVGRWLSPDPEKREQPRLGYGIMLLWAVTLCEVLERGGKPESASSITIDLRRPGTLIVGNEVIATVKAAASASAVPSPRAEQTPPAVRAYRRTKAIREELGALESAELQKGAALAKAMNKPARTGPNGEKALEQLFVCPACKRGGFTAAGLRAHKGTKHCRETAAAAAKTLKGVKQVFGRGPIDRKAVSK